MATGGTLTLKIQGLIERMKAGDETARKEMLNCACDRLTRLTRKMLKGFPRVKRWEQTDDVFQNASLRLYRTLSEVTPATPNDFFRLAALNIRRELLDLAKHYRGPQGMGTKHASVAGDMPSSIVPPAPGGEPSALAAWTEFHSRIGELPEEERELFDLLWYQGLTQGEAGTLLGISTRTVKRRWASARLKLFEMLDGTLPDI
jgi:RNA polymerase sigma factor (sigma-70 family)